LRNFKIPDLKKFCQFFLIFLIFLNTWNFWLNVKVQCELLKIFVC